MALANNVLVLGGWHLGSVYAACVARGDAKVQVWDQRAAVQESWNKAKAPVYEPGLNELIGAHFGKNLFWCQSPEQTIPSTDWIVMAYDTDINERDEVQMSTVEEGFNFIIAKDLKPTSNFMFTSQLPVGTSRKFLKRIQARHPAWKGRVLYFPENLRLGTAIESFDKQDRVVLGFDSADREVNDSLVAQFRNITGLHSNPIESMSLESAEMVKHSLNAFIGTCIVFANQISDLCEKTGANAWDVLTSLKKDSRVGPRAFLNPGLGFAGGTIGRDVRTLSILENNFETQKFFRELYSFNDSRNEWVIRSLERDLGSLNGRTVVLLGVTYKAGTSTVRRSPALAIGKMLKDKGAACLAIDPMADLSEIPQSEQHNIPFKLVSQFPSAFEGADAAVLLTDWPQFKELNWPAMMSMMKQPLVVDTKKFLIAYLANTNAKCIFPGEPEIGVLDA